jgi:hypothetical protein
MSAVPIFNGSVRQRGVPAGWSDVDNEDAEGERGFRRVACMMLLSGYLGAGQGDLSDRKWIEGPEARLLADLVDLPYWPPRPDQFYSVDELERRALLLSGPVHASRTLYARNGGRLTDRERRLRRRAAYDSLFASAGTTATAAVESVLSFWGAFLGVSSYTHAGAGP